MNLSELNDLDFSNAGAWPLPLKIVMALVLAGAVAGAGYFLDTSDMLKRLQSSQRKEADLKAEFTEKQGVLATIEAYREQNAELQTILDSMLRQLPTSTEMPDLLEDIYTIGRRNGLSFELFKPQDEQPRDFYAAKPISIRARATYHQFGSFVSSVAALPRIVTLEQVLLESTQRESKDKLLLAEREPLTIEATLQTYRYLDESEVAELEAQKEAQNKSKRRGR